MSIILFVVWTILIQTVDVRQAGQTRTEIGFAAFNEWFHQLTGVYMLFYTVTDWLGLVPICVCLLFGMADLFSGILIVLPLYPKTVGGYVYAVNLWMYTKTAAYNRMVYWFLFLMLVVLGIWEVYQAQRKKEYKKWTACSVILSFITVVYLILARETYAAATAFLLLAIKGILVFRSMKLMCMGK